MEPEGLEDEPARHGRSIDQPVVVHEISHVEGVEGVANIDAAPVEIERKGLPVGEPHGAPMARTIR